NYWAAITQLSALAATQPGLAKKAVMLSDGDSTIGGPAGQTVLDALAGLNGVKVDTFAVGSLASCNGTSAMNFGTLAQIAQQTGGTCAAVTPAQALTAVPDAIRPKVGSFGVNNTGG